MTVGCIFLLRYQLGRKIIIYLVCSNVQSIRFWKVTDEVEKPIFSFANVKGGCYVPHWEYAAPFAVCKRFCMPIRHHQFLNLGCGIKQKQLSCIQDKASRSPQIMDVCRRQSRFGACPFCLHSQCSSFIKERRKRIEKQIVYFQTVLCL